MFGLGTILLFLVVLSVLVLAHEFGHFITALKSGCKVEEFGIGFPPKAFSIKRNGIEYSVNWIPIGGFVKIKGESGEHQDDPDSFASKPAWQRLIILLAGVFMNFVLAAVLLSVGFIIGLPSAVDDGLPAGAKVSDSAVRVVELVADSPADEAGLLVGDTIVSIDGMVFEEAELARNYLAEQGAVEVSLMVEREGQEFAIAVTPEYLDEAERDALGVGLLTTGFVSFPLHLAVWHGIETTVYYTGAITVALFEILKNLFMGKGLAMDISGPVGIAVFTGQMARLGLVYLIQFTAVLSINLAIINAFPFPALDGGRVLFLIIEKLRRKPVSERIEGIIHNSGFLFLMLLILLITFRDFIKFGDQIWGAITGVFGV